MKDIKVYIKVDGSKPPEFTSGFMGRSTQDVPCILKDEDGWFNCFYTESNGWLTTSKFLDAEKCDVKYWLKEVSLSTYVVGFGRWLLKNAFAEFDPQGFLLYKYDGKFVNTEELMYIYFESENIVFHETK